MDSFGRSMVFSACNLRLTAPRSRLLRKFVRSFVRSSFVRSLVLQILILPRLGPGRTAVRLGTGGAPALAKLKFEKISVSEKCFSSISVDFGGARRLLTSKSDSLTNFASDTQLLRSV